jgi:hypothetical protein
LASRLYDDGASRPYVDCDLLVEPGRFADAESLLQAFGFARDYDTERSLPEWALHGYAWTRPGTRIAVDLHWTLMHYGVAPEQLWRAFTHGSQLLRVGGVLVDVPGDTQLALHTAVHVAEHGAAGTPAEDLLRAIDRFPVTTWVGARELSRELDAAPAFAAGLRMLDSGRELAVRLGLAPGGVGALSLDRISRAQGWLAKARVAFRIAIPEPTFMRSFDRPLARRGKLGLAAAYAWRPVDLAVRTPPALLARRSARRLGDDGL